MVWVQEVKITEINWNHENFLSIIVNYSMKPNSLTWERDNTGLGADNDDRTAASQFHRHHAVQWELVWIFIIINTNTAYNIITTGRQDFVEWQHWRSDKIWWKIVFAPSNERRRWRLLTVNLQIKYWIDPNKLD